MSSEFPSRFPTGVQVDTTRPDLRDYWQRRVAQHMTDSYAGVPLWKFPEDLRTYEHLLWDSRANVVIELGAAYGGSALWFRDRLKVNAGYGRCGPPLVITVDVDASVARDYLAAANNPDGIVLLEGDVTNPALAAGIANLVPPGARCLVIEDTAHEYRTTFAALQGFSHFVPPGGYFIVEDGCVDFDHLRPSDQWPRGVVPAITDWLASPAGAGFVQRRDLELYGLSCHPCGFLERRAA